jgi:predicted nucleotidyltransferase
MLDRNAAIGIVHDYANEIKANGVNLRTVIMFGSFANGSQHEWSDIDVALAADEFTGFYPQDIGLIPYKCIRKPYSIIEAHTYPTDYFNHGDPFINEIKRTGIKIV